MSLCVVVRWNASAEEDSQNASAAFDVLRRWLDSFTGGSAEARDRLGAALAQLGRHDLARRLGRVDKLPSGAVNRGSSKLVSTV